MDAIDNFLIGKNKLLKYLVDTTKKKYIDTNYFRAEFLPQFIKKNFDLDIRIGSITQNPNFPQTHGGRISTKIGTFELVCGGSSLNKEVATSKAVGEFLERVSSYKPWGKNIFGKNYFARSLLSPFSFGVFERDEVYWGGARKKIKGGETTTNGCGGGFSRSMAIVAAWLELIERDGFFVYWLNTFAPRQIDLKSYVEEIKEKEQRTQPEEELLRLNDLLIKYKIKLYLLDTTTDVGVPSVCSVVEIIDPKTKEREFAIGGSAGYEPMKQLSSAILEAIGTLRSAYGKTPIRIPDDYEPFSDPTMNIRKRSNLYRCEENNKKFVFFISSTETVSVEEWSGVLKLRTDEQVLIHLIKVFREKFSQDSAFNVFMYEFTNEALRNLSYHVVRVICRGLYPIYLLEHLANPQHPRIKQFATAIGKEKKAVLNIWPHPFP